MFFCRFGGVDMTEAEQNKITELRGRGLGYKILGYPKLTKLIEAYPEMFEIKEYIGGEDDRVVGYKYRVKVQEK